MLSYRTKRLIEYAHAYREKRLSSEKEYAPQKLDHWINAAYELAQELETARANRQPWYIRLLSLIGWQPARPLVRSH